MDIPEIVRVASPVYFKNARSGPRVTPEERLNQRICAVDMFFRYCSETKQSKPGAKGLCVPAAPGAK